MAGIILDRFPDAAGYRLFFIYLFAVTIFGLVLTVIWLRRTKTRRAEILEKLENRIALLFGTKPGAVTMRCAMNISLHSHPLQTERTAAPH